MAALNTIARDYADEIRDGIAWVIVWKTGRSWNATAVWLDPDTDTFEPDDLDTAREVLAQDPGAVMLNGYYCGHFGEDMTVAELADGIRWHYENGYNTLDGSTAFAWCDMFVDWCFLTAFGYEDALRLLCQPERSAGAGCTYSLGYYRKKGQFYTSDPKPGDQIFFGSSVSNSSHTGIVEKVDGSRVHTIEGNTSDQVARRSYALGASNIIGYGRPNYDAENGGSSGSTGGNSSGSTGSGGSGDTVYTVVRGDTLSGIAARYGTTYKKLAAYNGIANPNVIRVGQKIRIPGTGSGSATPKKTNAELAKEVIAGKWGNGSDRRKQLEAAGYNYDAVQKLVNEMLR